MKVRKLLLLLLMLPSVSVLAFQNEPDGFRGIKWGTPISANKQEMKGHLDMREHKKAYTRNGDKMAIGAAELLNIDYSYHRDRLHSVMIFAWDKYKRPLLEAFETRFGKPRLYSGTYLWLGDVATISINCRYPSWKNRCVVVMKSEEMEKLVKEDKKRARKEERKKAKDASKDF